MIRMNLDPVVGVSVIYEETFASIFGVEHLGRANVIWNSQAYCRGFRLNVALRNVRPPRVVEIWKCIRWDTLAPS